MKFIKAIKRLGKGQVLGIKGTDWSWYYKWGEDVYGEEILVDEVGKEASFTYATYTGSDWIIIDKKKVDKYDDVET